MTNEAINTPIMIYMGSLFPYTNKPHGTTIKSTSRDYVFARETNTTALRSLTRVTFLANINYQRKWYIFILAGTEQTQL